MADSDKRSTTSISKKWALLVAVCTVPLFFVFAYFGDPGRGQAACVCAVSITFAARFFGELRTSVCYWATLAVIVLLHTPVILLVPWPMKQLEQSGRLGASLTQRRTARSTEHQQFGIVCAKRRSLPLRRNGNAEEEQPEHKNCNEHCSTARFIHAWTPLRG
jgi:hypothetical protein